MAFEKILESLRIVAVISIFVASVYCATTGVTGGVSAKDSNLCCAGSRVWSKQISLA